MFISSLPTTQAKKKLEEIKSEEVNGKQLLKDFLERDLKNIFARQTSAKAVMDAAEKPNSNIYKFAMLLNTKSNKELFAKAIDLQAKSLGTNKNKGLFKKLILCVKSCNWLYAKPNIKAFLLATKDEDIGDSEVLNCEVLGDEEKKSRRMKNANIAEKLKSKRLSNILKVFMVLVMWDYIRIKEQEEKKAEEEKRKEREKAEEEKRKKEEEKRKKQEEAEEEERKKQEKAEEEKRKKQEEDEKKAAEEKEKRWAEGRLTKEEFNTLTYTEKTKLTKLVVPEGVALSDISSDIFKNLTEITIPDGLTKIVSYALFDHKSLTKITIPDSVQTIGRSAFYGCEGLKTVTIPDSVETIGIDAFSDCKSLTKITIPKKVKTVGKNAFWRCTSLNSVTIESEDTQIDEKAFERCKALTEDNIHVPNSEKGAKQKQQILAHSQEEG